MIFFLVLLIGVGCRGEYKLRTENGSGEGIGRGLGRPLNKLWDIEGVEAGVVEIGVFLRKNERL
jgi:hypothetical protein